MDLVAVNDFSFYQIMLFISETLIFELLADNNTIVLSQPDKTIPLGGMIY